MCIMQLVRLDSISMLRAVTKQHGLPYASLITEVGDDGTTLCGVELELPHMDRNKG